MYCMHFRFRGVHDVMAVGGLTPLPLRFATVALIALLYLVAASCVVVSPSPFPHPCILITS